MSFIIYKPTEILHSIWKNNDVVLIVPQIYIRVRSSLIDSSLQFTDVELHLWIFIYYWIQNLITKRKVKKKRKKKEEKNTFCK